MNIITTYSHNLYETPEMDQHRLYLILIYYLDMT